MSVSLRWPVGMFSINKLPLPSHGWSGRFSKALYTKDMISNSLQFLRIPLANAFVVVSLKQGKGSHTRTYHFSEADGYLRRALPFYI